MHLIVSKLVLFHFQQFVGSFCISKNNKSSSNNPHVYQKWKHPENTLFKIYMQKLFHLKLKYKTVPKLRLQFVMLLCRRQPTEGENFYKENIKIHSSETSPPSGRSFLLWNGRVVTAPCSPRPLNLGLRCLHQVKSSVFLHQFLPLPGLNQAVNHSSQCLPFQTEAPPTATLHETGPLFPTAHKKCTNLQISRNITGSPSL